MENNKDKNRLNIELSQEIAQGTYANLAVISHSTSEFIIDFVRVLPGMPKAPVKSRIVLTPDNAKRLLTALNDNIKKFEQNFGEIKGNFDRPVIPMNFGGPPAQA